MKRIVIISIVSVLLAMIVSSYYFTRTCNDTVPKQTLEQQKIGLMIQQLQSAIKTPTDRQSMHIIYQYGTDSRYYVMVRGWLIQSLNGIESQLNAQQSEAKKAQLNLHAQALTSAIRSIDLE